MTEYVPAGVSAEGLDDRVWHLLYKVFREEVLEPVDVLVDPRVLEELAQMPDGPDRVRRLVQVIKSHMSQIMGACGPAFSTWAADCVNEAWKGSGATYVPRKYVDLGCGKGDKTASIAKKFNIESQNVVGFEVACSHYNETERTTFTFKTCADGARLPGIEDASIDLVTILMTLHHSVNQNAVLQEVKRVLAPNGRVILKEHNVQDPTFGVYLDMYHCIFSDIFTPETPFTLRAFYHTRQEWVSLFDQCGFVHLWGSTIKFESMMDFFDSFAHKP